MSFITIIEDLKINKRTIFFSVLGQTYYFLIAFFLFKHDLFLMIDDNYLLDVKFYFIIGASFLMSLMWFLMNISVSTILLIFSNKNNKYIGNPSGIFINSMICSIGYLTFAMLINFLLDYDFKYFISFSFSFIAIRVIWAISKSLFLHRSFV
jgi:hypothetical protein